MPPLGKGPADIDGCAPPQPRTAKIIQYKQAVDQSAPVPLRRCAAKNLYLLCKYKSLCKPLKQGPENHVKGCKTQFVETANHQSRCFDFEKSGRHDHSVSRMNSVLVAAAGQRNVTGVATPI